MAIDDESWGEVPRGPNASALLAALGAAAEALEATGSDFLAASDITAPTWDPARPVWHLDTIERCYGVRAEPTMVAELRYRIARARIFARHSAGRWDDLVRVFAALTGTAGPDPTRLIIRAWPMAVYLYFSPEAAPPPAVLDRLRELLTTAVQDTAGFGGGVGKLGALFQLDTGPGFDVGVLAEDLGL